MMDTGCSFPKQNPTQMKIEKKNNKIPIKAQNKRDVDGCLHPCDFSLYRNSHNRVNCTLGIHVSKIL